jgi:hypothetical protein
MTAHPNHALIGMDIHAISGDLLMQRINDALKDIPEGRVATIDYSYPRPGTIEPVARQRVSDALASLLDQAEVHRMKSIGRIPSTVRVPSPVRTG